MALVIKQPETAEERKQYFDLRWRILRAPWQEPKGSAIDEIEGQCFHAIVTDDDKVIGVGRLQFNSADEAQIRYMAVEKGFESRGIGSKIVDYLEQEAAKHQVHSVVHDARKPDVGF